MLKSDAHANVRNQIGSNACHRMRMEGRIPGVVYGHDIENSVVELDKRDLDTLIKSYGSNALIDLHTEGSQNLVMIKEVQRDIVSNHIIHIDFQKISYDTPIHTMVPIRLVGKGKVESSEGVVQQQISQVEVECLPQNIPDSIDVDVSILKLGNPLKIADVELAQEISIMNNGEDVIAALIKADKKMEESEVEQLDIAAEVLFGEKEE
ncbi:MAG: 50S ribosomal protein L25 [Anaeromicrobium sp.]|jgi:large subunit ribosomal protein L25|uniref:50S ribosomal protein L25 n=1 Tax=Anaeromicrobium sp. TaxID=1929132 RepID=UPI0025F6F898|nr:50S ribosomal protein L25 [Anaeromicrobium sp.]MCT4593621.1 50S ribosomal protein L25 [Anaeromicrobium sp.]